MKQKTVATNKAVLYARVSSKEQEREGYSIPAQKKLLHSYAQKYGYEVVREFIDVETAKQSGRTQFNNMVVFLEENPEVRIILCEKTDRLYRNFKDYVTIDELDVTLIFVKEGSLLNRHSRSHEKFIHGIKVLMAKNYIDNLSEEVKKGQMEKAGNGFYPGGTPPVGYILKKVDGKSRVVVDEKNRNFAVKMFEYYASGSYSLFTLIQKLKNQDLFVPGNFPHHSTMQTLSKSTMQRLLRNPFYCGNFKWSGKIYKGAHEPLISKDLWNKVQAVLDKLENRGTKSKYNTLPFILKGVLSCGECGRTITAERKIKPSGKEYVYYHCTKFNIKCTQKAVNEKALEKQVEKSLEGLKVPVETQEYITVGLKQSFNLKRDIEDKTKENLEIRKKKLEQRLAVLYEDRLDKIITPEFYQGKFDEYSKEITDLDTKISRYTLADLDYYSLGAKILELSNNLLFLYKNAEPDEKHDLLNFLLSNSTLKDGKLLISYKKPFDLIYQRVSRSEVRRGRDSNPR